MIRAGKTSPIGRRLFFAAMGTGLAVMTVIAGLRGLITAEAARRRFTAELEEVARGHQNAIAESLWVFDRVVLAAQLEGIVGSAYISYAAVVDESGTVTAFGTKRDEGGFELIVPVEHRDQGRFARIGTLTLQADLGTLRDISWLWIFDDLPLQALALGLVASFLYLYFDLTVARRLEGDAKRLADFELGGAEMPFPRPAVDTDGEIDVLERRFNELTSRLRSSYREAEAARVAAEASERRYEALFAHSPVALCLEDFSAVRDIVAGVAPGVGPGEAEAYFTDHPGVVERCAAKVRLLAVNEAALDLVGVESLEQLAALKGLVALQGDAKVFISKLAAIARGEMRAYCEGTIETARGERLRVATSWEAVADETGDEYGNAILALMDVTERVTSQEALSANLREKEVLIRELFHRTKNNMQSILSLISFQSWKVRDEEIRDMLRGLETRVYSMSLVHRMLYEYNDLSRLSFSAFIREFSAYLSASEDIEKRGIRFDQRLEEIEVTVDIAVPFGLIIAELVGNALNHGFPDRRGGVITIELSRVDGEQLALVIANDGVGARPDFQVDGKGMGLQLVQSLAESQLGGTVEFDSPPTGGFRCRILARLDLYEVRV